MQVAKRRGPKPESWDIPVLSSLRGEERENQTWKEWLVRWRKKEKKPKTGKCVALKDKLKMRFQELERTTVSDAADSSR